MLFRKMDDEMFDTKAKLFKTVDKCLTEGTLPDLSRELACVT